MTLSFAFADTPEATMPAKGAQAALILGDIEKTVISNEIGDGKILDDCSIIINFETFRITVKPDGSFHGRRLSTHDRKPQQTNGASKE